MTKGFGAKLTPEQGCRSSLKCLFEDVTSGFYYGSDGLRSPLDRYRTRTVEFFSVASALLLHSHQLPTSWAGASPYETN